MRDFSFEEPQARRTLSDVFVDALALVRQDAGEYGFTALLGAGAGAALVVFLSAFGGPIGIALMAPSAFFAALMTYATACAAIRRVEDNLEPDTFRALTAVTSRSSAIITPMFTPIAIAFVGVLAASLLDHWIGNALAALLGLVIVAGAAIPAFQRALFIPALFMHSENAQDASIRANAAMRSAGPALAVLFGAALIPAGLFGLIALGAGFGAVTSAIATIAFVLTMPLCAAIATLILDATEPAAPGPTRANGRQAATPVEERLGRIRR